MRAFITGSRAYGRPRPDSDVDLVVLVDAATLSTLIAYSDNPKERQDKNAPRLVRYGDLNLVCCTEEQEYALWKCGTEALRRKPGPSDSKAAKEFLDGLRGELGILDNY